MATWISFPKARRFPAIRAAYGDVQFKKAVEAEIAATSTWARLNTGFASGDANYSVDVSAVPGVAALTSTGTLA